MPGLIDCLYTLAALAMLICAAPALAFNTVANGVSGQLDFGHNGVNRARPRSLNAPDTVAIDHSVVPNRLYVADTGNNRVLGWSSVANFTNGQAADLVIGQADFRAAICNYGGVTSQSLCNPSGVAVDLTGNLYVADTGNNRVLEFNSPYNNVGIPGIGNNVANLVYGQSDFSSGSCGNPISSATLCGPVAVVTDYANNLYVADTNDNRVLEYTPMTGDTLADAVFGQPDMHSGQCNFGTNSVNAASLCGPEGVAADRSGNLYVADTLNNRVLEYNSLFSRNNNAATLVFGQVSFTTNGAGVPAANTLSHPEGLTVGYMGNMYIADTGNQRVLEYITPLVTTSTPGSGETQPDFVFGQNNDFGSAACNFNVNNPSATSLCTPEGVALDSDGRLYVSDTGNGRVLVYYSPRSGTATADVVLGKFDFVHNGLNIVTAQSLYHPFGIAIDRTVTPNHIYVADAGNNRVLGWSDITSFTAGGPADLVFGQPDFSSWVYQNGGVTGQSMNNPEGVTVDQTGNLYIADTYDDRVLEYNTPYLRTTIPGSGDTIPDVVFGQPDFTTIGCNGAVSFTTQPPPTAHSMCQPVGVAVDGAGNLYVGEAGNNRVLEFDNAIATRNTIPNMVFGQPNFTSDNDYQCNSQSRPFGSPSATTLCTPENLAVDAAGNLYVSDHWFNRVLEYNRPAATRNTTPNFVFGQPDFLSAQPGAGQDSLCQPKNVAVDPAGDLYIADQCNSRLLEYNTPLATGSNSADLVFGQLGDFQTTECDLGSAPSANSLCFPAGVAIDSNGNLYVGDVWNNRVLEYNQPLL
ncbi:MAG TPA: NHL repeat-containing protein [Candidatus Binataceae bacterium]|nr:NHL repeat-containing protein [Candidatus Binataceae bacterium]